LEGEEETMNELDVKLKKILDEYEKSRRYRDVMIGKGIFENKRVMLLKGERSVMEEENVCYLSGDENVKGSVVVSNVRVMWGERGNEKMSLSLPFVVMQEVRIKEKKKKTMIKVDVMEMEEKRDGKRESNKINLPSSSSLIISCFVVLLSFFVSFYVFFFIFLSFFLYSFILFFFLIYFLILFFFSFLFIYLFSVFFFFLFIVFLFAFSFFFLFSLSP
jgi:hypothetical protein